MTNRTLRQFHDVLLAAYGPQGWWPGRSRTEIVIGAILTQNTNWRNVEKAIERLRSARLIDWAALRDVKESRLAEMIRPSGYFNIKARRLKCFTNWLWETHGGRLEPLRRIPPAELRSSLLSVKGIGPETADSILLYALDFPTFVVDAYARRLAVRHRLIDKAARYDDLKALFERNLPADVALFNEYHALIVAVGKRHCKTVARCSGCPLERFPHNV